MHIFPFVSCTTESLVIDGIFHDIKPKNTIQVNVSPKSNFVRKKMKYSNNANANPISKSREQKKNLFSKINYNPFIDIKCSYLSPKDLNNNVFGRNSAEFSIFHNNVRSANKNIPDVMEIFRKCDGLPSIIAITETKLNSSKSLPEFDGYNFENVNSCTSAGGVGIFVLDQFDYYIREDLSLGLNDCEDLWIEVNTRNDTHYGIQKPESIVVSVIYRHPKSNYDKFSDLLEKKLAFLSQNDKKTVIVGDLNIDIMKYKALGKVTNYVHSIVSHGFNLFIDVPTRITLHSATCIDHVYSNISVEDIESLVLESDVSDHYSTLTKIKCVSTKHQLSDTYYRKTNLSDEQWALFNSELQQGGGNVKIFDTYAAYYPWVGVFYCLYYPRVITLFWGGCILF